jgi:hypothetical protein
MAAFDGLSSWADYQRAEPGMADRGRALLCRDSDVAIGFLATVGAAGAPHLAPVCPIFCDQELYLSVGADTPKRLDLDDNGRYVLHAFLGADDAEFQIAGKAVRIDDTRARQRVQAAIRFGAFGREDPIYRLWLARCMYGYWQNPGQPNTRAVRWWWRAG